MDTYKVVKSGEYEWKVIECGALDDVCIAVCQFGESHARMIADCLTQACLEG